MWIQTSAPESLPDVPQQTSSFWAADLLAFIHPQAPAFWLLAGLATLPFLPWLERRSPSGWRSWIRSAHHLLIPYAGLLLGGLSPRLMGLNELDWATSLGFGLLFIFVVGVLLVAARITLEAGHPPHRRPSIHPGRATPLAGEVAGEGGWRRLGRLLLDSGYEEFYRVFLRGGLWELLVRWPTPVQLPGYWAIWLATLLVLPEILWRRWSASQKLLDGVILLTTSILFFYTRNFWLCWILHGAIRLIFAPLAAEPVEGGSKPTRQRTA